MKKPGIIKKILLTTLWIAIAGGGIALLVAAVHSKDVKLCKGVQIDIVGVNNNFFIDKSDVLGIITNYVGGSPEGKSIAKFNLNALEKNLERDVWVKNAELYFDNNELLRVSIDEREPVARIFTTGGSSFYIDSSLKLLPLSDKFSARLPVFTNFSYATRKLSKADSVLLLGIRDISEAIQKDDFVMAMIDQVDITPQRSFEMIPKMGNQLILFGDANDIAGKMEKLKLFYQSVMQKAGWNKYSTINLQFKNQVVAKIKDAADKTSDSLRAMQIMQAIAERSARLAEDSVRGMKPDTKLNSTDTTMIQRSVQRDEPAQVSTDAEEEPQREPVVMPATPVSSPATVQTSPSATPRQVTAAPKPKPPAAVERTGTTASQREGAVTMPQKTPRPEPKVPKAVMERNN